jgi:hypothetical protein
MWNHASQEVWYNPASGGERVEYVRADLVMDPGLQDRVWKVIGGRPEDDADPEVKNLDDAVRVTLQYERDQVALAVEQRQALERELAEVKVAVQAVRDGARAEAEPSPEGTPAGARREVIDAAVMARLRAPFGCEFIPGTTPDHKGRWRIHDANDDAIASVSHLEEGYARLIVKALNEHFERRSHG